jgi:glutaconate CoA-transferase, subunit A
MSKVHSLEEAAELIPDGATVALGGLSMNATPMALVRALIRRGAKDLTLVPIVNGMAVDWLVAAGCVSRVITGLVSFEGFGLAPNFRRAVQKGDIALEEYSEYLLIARLRAAAHDLPFVPSKAGLGTDVLDLHPDTTRLEHDEATGTPYVAATPLPIDVSIVHASEADALGNVRVAPKLVWMDSELVNAAETTIVTVEKLAPTSSFRAAPANTTYPRFMVDAVVEVPWGAYPTSSYPVYRYDGAFFEAYSAASRDADTFKSFFEERVVGPPTHAGFLDANGGARTLLDIRRRTT